MTLDLNNDELDVLLFTLRVSILELKDIVKNLVEDGEKNSKCLVSVREELKEKIDLEIKFKKAMFGY